ncbi:MAG: DUF2911 domain-containing protein [Kofleriaceae bacterium]
MQAVRIASILVVALMAVPTAHAQALEIPAASSKARAEQRVGVTDFAIDYSSPAVKKRKIWGELVPYDKAWRAGANAATKLTASRDFMFAGTAVKAGAYSVFMIPGKATWAVILNADPAAGQVRDDKKDVVRVSIKPVALGAPRERLLYLWNDAQDTSVALELEWERIRIRVPITVDTKAHVAANIDKAVGEAWRPHSGAASYLFEAGETDRALALVDKSIAIQSTWRNEWLRAQIVMKKGNKAEALAAANRAQQLGKGDAVFEEFIKPNLLKTVAGWK